MSSGAKTLAKEPGKGFVLGPMSCWFSRLLSRTSNIGLLSLEPILTPGPAPSGVSKLSLDKLLDKSDKRLQNNSRRTNGSCAAARRIWITTLGFGATLALKPNPYEAHGKTGHTPLARSCSPSTQAER